MKRIPTERELKEQVGKTIQSLVEQTNVPVLAHEWHGMTLKVICGNKRVLSVDYRSGNLWNPDVIYIKLVDVLLKEYPSFFPEESG